MDFAIGQLNAGKDVDPAIWTQIAEAFRSSDSNKASSPRGNPSTGQEPRTG
jgi:hypothetical protein